MKHLIFGIFGLLVVACCTSKPTGTACPGCPPQAPEPTMCDKVAQDYVASLACGAEFVDAVELTGIVFEVLEHEETKNIVLTILMDPGYKSLHRSPGRFLVPTQSVIKLRTEIMICDREPMQEAVDSIVASIKAQKLPKVLMEGVIVFWPNEFPDTKDTLQCLKDTKTRPKMGPSSGDTIMYPVQNIRILGEAAELPATPSQP
jgi:hypothetical protein